MELTIENLELDKIYKINDNKYIVRHKVYAKNASSYAMNKPVESYYVYDFSNYKVTNLVYGRLVERENNKYVIINNDTEEEVELDMAFPPIEVVDEEYNTIWGEMLIYNADPNNYEKNKNK